MNNLTFKSRVTRIPTGAHSLNGTIHRVTKPITVYKKAIGSHGSYKYDVIVKLKLAPGALVNIPNFRDWLVGGKMRATCAKVISITGARSKRRFGLAYSTFSETFQYWPGKVCRPARAFDYTSYDCSSGIHFFRTRAEAVDYKG